MIYGHRSSGCCTRTGQQVLINEPDHRGDLTDVVSIIVGPGVDPIGDVYAGGITGPIAFIWLPARTSFSRNQTSALESP